MKHVDNFYNYLKKDQLTENDIQDCLSVMRQVIDPNVIHIMEKALWQRVLMQLAVSNPIAEVALQSINIY
jgi:hypothetical protein